MDGIVLESEHFELISELDSKENWQPDTKHSPSDSDSIIKDEIPPFLSPSPTEVNSDLSSSKCDLCGRTFDSR